MQSEGTVRAPQLGDDAGRAGTLEEAIVPVTKVIESDHNHKGVYDYDRSLEGTSRPLVNWISPQFGPPMRQPYSAGSATSGRMTLLEEGHKGVRLTREEAEKLACWIDLVVPYCGDYSEANAWLPFERARYNYFFSNAPRPGGSHVSAVNTRRV